MTAITNQFAHSEITKQFTLFKRSQTDRASRIEFSNALTEAYFEANCDIPPVTVLDRMATLILQDELADTNVHKMSHNEFPLLSDRQRDTRERRERSMAAASSIAADGADYRIKSRDSNRKMREMFGN